MLTKKNKLVLPIIFIIAVISIQLVPWYVVMLFAAAALLFNIYIGKDKYLQAIALIAVLYCCGYLIAEGIRFSTFQLSLVVEWKVILSRLSLIGFIIPFYIFTTYSRGSLTERLSVTSYRQLGGFTNKIYFPWIWKGFIQDPIWRFLLIASSVVVISFSFFIDIKETQLLNILFYALLFSFINSICEEILWRGYILSYFVSLLGEKFGSVISSIGFGFYHYTLGIPWIFCALFSIFGMVLSGIAIKSRGLLPVIIFHMILNVMFVLVGMIF